MKSDARNGHVVLASIVVLCCAGAAVCGYLLAHRPPPGDWIAGASLAQRRATWDREKAWADEPFTAIGDDSSFLGALKAIRLRLQTSLEPEACDRLRQQLFDQLVSRKSGDLAQYRRRCEAGRATVLDDRNRAWVSTKHKVFFDSELSVNAGPGEVFDRFWQAEYADNGGGKRFAEVALGEAGAVIVIDEVRKDEPVLLLDSAEQARWYNWPGARRQGSVRMHFGSRGLSAILAQTPKCKYAQVALLVRTMNQDIICWVTGWYWDGGPDQWEMDSSIVVTSRRKYIMPV